MRAYFSKATLVFLMTKHRRTLLILGPALLAIIFIVLYLTSGRYYATDDAYIQAGKVDISSNVSGRILEILVKDNKKVKKGDILFIIDPEPFTLEVAEAKAKVTLAKLKIMALEASLLQYQAEEESARQDLSYLKREYERQQTLQIKNLISKTQFDKARNDYEIANSRLKAMTAQTTNILASLGGKANSPIELHPEVLQAQAALDKAELNLSYTKIPASIDGTVTQVEQVQVGTYINAGAPLFALLSSDNIWIEANFKENDLTYIRPGQTVTFTIDSYPDENFTAVVDSIRPGTGSAFSLLPPENASGNWVKVVQRLAIRIKIDSKKIQVPLAAGLSVNVTIDTGYYNNFWFGKEKKIGKNIERDKNIDKNKR